jgi:ATP/maltotriose-dependent transcriptional regulator MalT
MTQIPSVADGQRQGAAAGEEAGLAVGSPTWFAFLPRLRARRQLVEVRATDLGFSVEEAATFLEQSTVKTHLIHLYSKLGVHSRTQAVARAPRLLG